jgi:CubicO group peptidase (beta-lactamase class C family)
MLRCPQSRIALLSLALLATGADASEPRIQPDPPRIAERMLRALAEANGVPGMGAAVVRDGSTIWTGSAGLRDVERNLPVDRDTVFRLASVSKIVAATGVAKLHEQGRLDVDAPVQSLLPWLQAGWAPLTTRQLAAHISGLPHYQAVDDARGSARYGSVRDAVAIFRDRDLLSSPGTRYAYSSWGYTLLSAVVEARAGMPFLDYLAQEVTPGLAIGVDRTDGNDPAVSLAYEFEAGRVQRAAPHDYSYTWAGGGLAATPEALARFGARVLDGGVVAPRTVEWMLQPSLLADGTSVRERDYEVGLGWRTSRDADGERIAHHAGVTNGARSVLVTWPGRRLSVSLLSNARWVSSIEQTAMMLAAPFKLADGASGPVPASKDAACPLAASRYQGEFDGKEFFGRARFAMEDGLCIGELSLPMGALRDWLNAPMQKDSTRLQVIGMDPRGGLARAALVTPIGLYDLRLAAKGSGYGAMLGTTRTLAIRLH